MPTNLPKSPVSLATYDKGGRLTWADPSVSWDDLHYRWTEDGFLPSNELKGVSTIHTTPKS